MRDGKDIKRVINGEKLLFRIMLIIMPPKAQNSLLHTFSRFLTRKSLKQQL